MPEYPGGEVALMNFISTNYKYSTYYEDIKTTIYVQVIIDTNGRVTNPKILKGIGFMEDEEALRIIRLMPKWTSGELAGKKVKVQYVIPIRFGSKSLTSNISNEKNNNKSNTINIQKTSTPSTIIPGVGIDNIKLNTSTYKDVLTYKNLKFDVDSGEGIACGDNFSCHNFWKRYSNKESGLLIEFSSKCFIEGEIPKNYKLTLVKIILRNNDGACLKNGLCIGKANYLEVVNIYGPIPKDWKNESYLRFDKKGIAFRFGKDSKLSEVELFEPEK